MGLRMVPNLEKIDPGYLSLHPDELFNYQFNKGISLGFVRISDLKEVVPKIHTLDDWIYEMERLADQAYSEQRTLNAAYYYRMAEFFTLPTDPKKRLFYEKFRKLFLQVIKDNNFEEVNIPYGSGFLSTYHIKHSTDFPRGTILIHGGFDSFIEEFFSLAYFLAEKGYEIYLFDGPGQGKPLFESGLKLIPDWEKPVSSILNYFNLNDVTLIGISLGGYLSLRAAAFDQRISKVIAFGVIFDFYDARMNTLSLGTRLISRLLLSFQREKIFNSLIQKAMEKDPVVNWSYSQSMFVFGVSSPYEVVARMKQFNLISVSNLITQDVLLLHGEEDQVIPVKMYFNQRKALTKAKSVTGRIFTPQDNASSHCQMGNLILAYNTIHGWLEKELFELNFIYFIF